MPGSRSSALLDTTFDEISARFEREIEGTQPVVERAMDRSVQENTRRAVFSVMVAPETGDLLHNGRDGLRARYWISPHIGERANSDLIAIALSRVPLPSVVRGDGVEMSQQDIIDALNLGSAKIWLAEDLLRKDGKFLHSARWAMNEHEQDNPRLWQWTPRAVKFNVMTAWLTPHRSEWISPGKRDRSLQIHRWGFT